ncbi:type II toxin-antitoxin system VapC family toxin [Microbacterium sp. WCS2018Hpa-9]|uniref:type II toxin-antitoxin system VapC family toxin n=1 Tax=Microbacterium sp. WCS2018Hpa-9 TaxID=3073635 RepID=UPI0028898DB1|nr:type II toxin-antitoxin system VapC family toxin [Microbacterium sp. WCS2018Hpa-9]
MTSESFVLPTSADLLLDTSAAIALVLEDSEAHELVRSACAGLFLGLAGHALLETYSVQTRLPGGSRLSPAAAARVIAQEFPRSVALSSDDAVGAVSELAEAGIAGGAVYDGLVALAARSAGITLLTCDRRAIGTYAKLKVDVEIV